MASRHIEAVIATTNASVPARPGATDTATAMIERSWKRCVTEYGLDPAQSQPARILESVRLREHQERAEQFLRVARGGLEQLYKRVAPLGYVLLLTDADGVTVDFIGNDTWDRELKRSGLYLGADWNEAHAGTCAVGTCIVERKSLTCHRVDHFDATHISLTCSAAPLFDPMGDFMGVLDVSALTSPEARDSQHLARHMTAMFGQMIEDANFLRHFHDRWILRLGKDWTLVDVSGEYMLAFDESGTIVGANTSARRAFAVVDSAITTESVVGRHLTDVFKTSMDNIWHLARAGVTSERTVLTTFRHELLYATGIVPRQRSKMEAASSTPRTPKKDVPRSFSALDSLAGNDKQMERLIDHAKRLVDRQVNILLHGETGTGKEIVARALHESSERRQKPFVAVNCAAIPESLIESELFGYAAGSFTGARNKGMRGLILQSDGGTLFLDEIGDMPLHLQTRLLRVISEKEVVPLGANTPVSVDLTIIAASHRDLRRLIAENGFREDLYYRLCGTTLHLPPLRTRTDKDYIIERIIDQESAQSGYEVVVCPEALDRLLQYGWPGNIRELRNVIRFALAICDDHRIELTHLPQELQGLAPSPAPEIRPATAADEPQSLDSDTAAAPEISAMLTVLRRHHWNITAVARELGVCRATIYRQMKRLNIVSPTHL